MTLDVQPNTTIPSAVATGGALLDCLLLVARAHQVTCTREALLAGLPLDAQQLTPSLFPRAAKRAGLTSKIVQRELLQLNRALFPAVLLLQDNQACVLLSVDGDEAKVLYPELGDAVVKVPVNQLQEQYVGRAFYVRPQERYDLRATEIAHNTAAKNRNAHWFWGVIAEHKYLYRDVLLSALLINFFALVSPLFVMNVYDRVVPNHATDTLWVLSIGMLIAISADFGLRMMRTWFVDLAASRIDVTLSSTIMERVLGMKLSERPAFV
jgi:ATP-binding cassette subfamily C protein LapB